MSSTWFAAVLAFAAGLGGAVQIAVQGRLGDRVGSLEAVTTAAVVGGAIAITALLVARRSLSGVSEAVAGPKWQLLGGDYPWFLQAGVANQYLLGPTFQPSAFGVFLVLSVASAHSPRSGPSFPLRRTCPRECRHTSRSFAT